MATKTYFDTPREANKIYNEDIFVIQTANGEEITGGESGNNSPTQMYKIKMKNTKADLAVIDELFD